MCSSKNAVAFNQSNIVGDSFFLYCDPNGTLTTVYKCRGFYQKILQLQSQCIREGKYMTTDEMKKLIERYMNQVYQFCCYLTGNRQEAEDLCQDTFVTFVEKRRTVLFKEERENKNYLLGIAANHWKNQRRKMWRRAEVNEQLEEEQWNWICSEHNIEKELLEVERNRALQKATCFFSKHTGRKSAGKGSGRKAETRESETYRQEEEGKLQTVSGRNKTRSKFRGEGAAGFAYPRYPMRDWYACRC